MKVTAKGQCPKCKQTVVLDHESEGNCTNKKCGVKLKWRKPDADGNRQLVEVVKLKTT